MFNKIVKKLKEIILARKVQNTIVRRSIKEAVLEKRLIDSNESLTSKNGAPVTVTLTTYGSRINAVSLVIESLGYQTLKPQRIILWLDEDEYCDDNLPLSIKSQILRGLEVRFCPNYGSYKKIIPMVQKNQQENFITVDDDFYYPVDFIELLYKYWLLNKDKVIAFRGHEIRRRGVKALPYKKWNMEITDPCRPKDFFLTTGGGAFFGAGLLPSSEFDFEYIVKLSPNADDIWVNVLLRKLNVEVFQVKDQRPFRRRFVDVYDHDIGLYLDNGELNDMYINNVVGYMGMEDL